MFQFCVLPIRISEPEISQRGKALTYLRRTRKAFDTIRKDARAVSNILSSNPDYHKIKKYCSSTEI